MYYDPVYFSVNKHVHVLLCHTCNSAQMPTPWVGHTLGRGQDRSGWMT